MRAPASTGYSHRYNYLLLPSFLVALLPRPRFLHLSLVAFGAALLGASACGGPAMPQEARSARSATASDEKQGVQTSLYAELLKVERGEPLLSALPADVRRQLKALADALPAEERAALLQGGKGIEQVRPLLHLAAGGQNLAAYLALFSTPAGARELVQLRQSTREFADLLEACNTVAERAAIHVLRERAIDVAPGKKHGPRVLEQIADAARLLGETGLEKLALQGLAQVNPEGSSHARLAEFFARMREPELARKHVEAFEREPQHLSTPNQLPRLRALVAAAGQAAKPEPTTTDAVTGSARALMHLGKFKEALQLVEAHSDDARQHLGLATSLVRARLGEGACPGSYRSVATATLCRESWQAVYPTLDRELIEAAWHSGGGRDAHGVETMLGLLYVVPMMYGLTGQAAEGVERFQSALGELRDRAREARTLGPHLEALSVFADALATAFAATVSAPQGQRQRVALLDRQRLLLGANQSLDHPKLGRWGQAAALAVLALLAQDESIGAPLEKLRPIVLSEHAPSFGSLLLWHLLVENDAPGFVAAKGVLAEIAQTTQGSSFERSRWLILWAEAEAHLFPGDETYKTLFQIADKLDDARVPLGLRLRAALDIAGMTARRGQYGLAAEALESMVKETKRTQVANRDEQELLIAATGYWHAMTALDTTGRQRSEAVAALERLSASVSRSQAAPPTLQVWLTLWEDELRYQSQAEKCAGNRWCLKRAASERSIGSVEVERRVGVKSARLLANGVLPVGGVQIEFSYDREGRLNPVVLVEPRFLLAHVPPITVASAGAGR